MSNVYGPILPLQLDPRNLIDLVRAIQTRINIESNGSITDFTPASPLSAISEGQAFAQAELLFYLNNLPEAFSIQWFRQLGVQRIVGSRALATVTFYPAVGYTGAVIIPQNTKMYTSSGLTFVLTEQVILDPGAGSATGIVKSERWGSIYNVSENEINAIENRILGLRLATNLTPATGGRDTETIDEMKTRVFELMSRRNLTTSNDFENELRLIAPEAQIVKALTYEERFSLLSQDIGGIFIVAGDADGRPLPEATQKTVIRALKDKVVMGTSVSIIPPNITPIDLVIDIFYNPDTLTTSLDSAAESIYSSLSSYFNPEYLGLGSGIDYRDIVKFLYSNNQNVIQSINRLDVKFMIKDEDERDGYCAGFSGEVPLVGDDCIFDYSFIVDATNVSYFTDDPIISYKLWRCSISLTSSKTPTSLTFTYRDLYTP